MWLTVSNRGFISLAKNYEKLIIIIIHVFLSLRKTFKTYGNNVLLMNVLKHEKNDASSKSYLSILIRKKGSQQWNFDISLTTIRPGTCV